MTDTLKKNSMFNFVRAEIAVSHKKVEVNGRSIDTAIFKNFVYFDS